MRSTTSERDDVVNVEVAFRHKLSADSASSAVHLVDDARINGLDKLIALSGPTIILLLAGKGLTMLAASFGFDRGRVLRSPFLICDALLGPLPAAILNLIDPLVLSGSIATN